MSGGFNVDRFAALAPALACRLHWFAELGSTNDEAARLGRSGADHGTIVAAERQTAGRGRRGSVWHHNPSDGLACSFILRPQMPPALWPRLALAAGLAVAQVAERAGVAAEIKWPNDVLAGGAKFAGVLVESEGDCVVVGIGLNVNGRSFPDGIVATSLEAASGKPWEREWVLAAIARALLAAVDDCTHQFDHLLDAVRARCALTGRPVSYRCAGTLHHGVVTGLGPGGELLVEADGRTVRVVQADEVRLA